MADADRCVCCGEIVPEGRMVCPQCENGANKNREKKAAGRERLIEILKLGSCPSPYLCDENCKYANLERCYEERTADLLLEHGVIVQPVGWKNMRKEDERK